MALNIPPHLFWRNVSYVSLVDIARRDVPGIDQVAQPLGSVGIVLVVVCAHVDISVVADDSPLALATPTCKLRLRCTVGCRPASVWTLAA